MGIRDDEIYETYSVVALEAAYKYCCFKFGKQPTKKKHDMAFLYHDDGVQRSAAMMHNMSLHKPFPDCNLATAFLTVQTLSVLMESWYIKDSLVVKNMKHLYDAHDRTKYINYFSGIGHQSKPDRFKPQHFVECFNFLYSRFPVELEEMSKLR